MVLISAQKAKFQPMATLLKQLPTAFDHLPHRPWAILPHPPPLKREFCKHDYFNRPIYEEEKFTCWTKYNYSNDTENRSDSEALCQKESFGEF